jgi:hypothetical protein
MSTNIMGLFKRQSFSAPPERQILMVPVHEKVDKEEAQPILAAAAEKAAKSGLLWKWISYDGTAKLCHWDTSEQVFLRGSLNDWQLFFGTRWVVKDTNHQEYRGPSPVVTDRLLQAVLAHPDLPVASWALQLAKRREAEVK